jgi:multidrug resistance efflux pump
MHLRLPSKTVGLALSSNREVGQGRGEVTAMESSRQAGDRAPIATASATTIHPTGNSPSKAADKVNGSSPSAVQFKSVQRPQGNSHTKRTIWMSVCVALVIVLLAGSYFGYRYLDSTINYVSTDNARVASQTVPVGSMNAGQVANLRVDVGAQVHKGDVLGQIEVPSAIRTLQNGAPDLEYRGSSDQYTDVVSPLNGIVVAVPATVGQTVSQSQPLVTLMDPSQVWITANIDENEIARVRVGQEVQAYVAAADRTVEGKVLAITPATAASFLPTPATNATGDYSNPGQLVPIKVSVEDAGTILFTGATAQVRIRVT